ncbi:hypothetical protein JCM11641_006499 [Rhodosporidiobolus odoratus]
MSSCATVNRNTAAYLAIVAQTEPQVRAWEEASRSQRQNAAREKLVDTVAKVIQRLDDHQKHLKRVEDKIDIVLSLLRSQQKSTSLVDPLVQVIHNLIATPEEQDDAEPVEDVQALHLAGYIPPLVDQHGTLYYQNGVTIHPCQTNSDSGAARSSTFAPVQVSSICTDDFADLPPLVDHRGYIADGEFLGMPPLVDHQGRLLLVDPPTYEASNRGPVEVESSTSATPLVSHFEGMVREMLAPSNQSRSATPTSIPLSTDAGARIVAEAADVEAQYVSAPSSPLPLTLDGVSVSSPAIVPILSSPTSEHSEQLATVLAELRLNQRGGRKRSRSVFEVFSGVPVVAAAEAEHKIGEEGAVRMVDAGRAEMGGDSEAENEDEDEAEPYDEDLPRETDTPLLLELQIQLLEAKLRLARFVKQEGDRKLALEAEVESEDEN